jgi:hypothetical protein
VQILNEDDLRDCFAMFALIGVKTTSNFEEQAKWCYEMADAMLEARKAKDESGIASVKRTRKTK